jgi:hypothetical protein
MDILKRSREMTQDRELPDSELDLVSGGADPAVLKFFFDAVSNVVKAYGAALNDVVRQG